jgi:hypothetical protein
MDPYGSNIVATSRRADFAREAAGARLARTARDNGRAPKPAPESRGAPRHREASRPAIA